MINRRRVITWVVALTIAFSVGFFPRYLEVRKLRQEAAAAREEAGFMRLRDLMGLTYLEVTQNNYGVAGRHSTQFFDGAQELVQTAAPARRRVLQEILASRDAITAGLAKADPTVVAVIQDSLRKLYETAAGP